MGRAAIAGVTVAVALLVPGILALNCVRLLARDWYVRLEVTRLEPDRLGLTRAERTELALVGLHSVRPGGEGIELLREARLPSGKLAFGRRELRHMADVRAWMGRLYTAHLIGLAVVVALCALLAGRRATRPLVARALALGAVLTLGLAIAVVVVVAASYETFEESFHGLLFEGGSWRFRDADTLRRVYPDRFWSDTATVVGVGTVVQALALLGVGRLLRRRQANARGGRTRRS